AHQEAGDPARAITLHEQNLQDRTRVLGKNHPNTLTTRNNLAHAYRQAGRSGDAVTLLRSVVEGRTRVLGSDHPNTVGSRVGLVTVLTERGRSLLPGDTAGAWRDAAEAVRAVGPHFAGNPGVYGPALAHAYRLAADVLDTDGQPEAAAEYYRRALHAAEAAANVSPPAGESA
ncbi:tetratricopeptide repeat protein, partial [Kitasatospora sp. NPDC058201]|uniref:tetratricopeptide repeat protein n=1 Tax=Kitasatospora sp. NPDC058201 TaxID=3346379 RepID=UPI0036DE3B11